MTPVSIGIVGSARWGKLPGREKRTYRRESNGERVEYRDPQVSGWEAGSGGRGWGKIGCRVECGALSGSRREEG